MYFIRTRNGMKIILNGYHEYRNQADVTMNKKNFFSELLIDAGMPVDQKIERIQHFTGEHFFHPDGIMYSSWFWNENELRPFCPDDFENYHLPKAPEGYTPTGYQNGEDSAMASGLFLYAQSLRYQVTAEEQALEYAGKAFRSIKKIFALTEAAGERGFVCKPYDWKATQATSPDQFLCVYNGLWEYRKICGQQEGAQINQWLADMADWWRERDYTIHFIAVTWPILPHHAPAMATLNSMAYKATGNQAYLQEYQRLLNLADSWPTWIDRNRRELSIPTGWPVENKGVRWPEGLHGLEYDPARRDYLLVYFEVAEIWLTAVCADYFMKHENYLASLIKHAIGRHYKYMQFGLREDLLGLYNIQVDLERDLWKPLIRKGEQGSNPHAFFRVRNELCWGSLPARLFDLCVIGRKHAPEFCPGALDLARRLLSVLDSGRMRWMIDPDGKQVTDPKDGCLHVLSQDTLNFYLLGYWRAKYYGISLEQN
jgi:hypothetical protein